MYKKIAVIVSLLVTSLFLFACEQDNSLNDAYEKLSFDLIRNENIDEDNVISDLNLINELDNVNIEWESSNTDVITNLGVVNRTNLDVNLKLEATLSYKESFKVKTFNLKVLKLEENIETTFVVTFISDGLVFATEDVIEGNLVNEPNAPTKDGFSFVEWQLDGNPFDFDTIITKDITLVAIWEEDLEEYVVTFNTNGGTLIDSVIVLEGLKVNEPNAPTKDGFSFVEWQLNGETFDFNTPISSDITLNASYSIITYEITYVLSIGNNSLNNPKYYTVLDEIVLEEPTDHNDEFLGWFDSTGREVSEIVNKTGNLVLYAKFLSEDTHVNVITINGNTYLVDEIVNRNITTTNNDGSAILFESFDPVQIYNKTGYEQIVKNWNDIFYNDTAFIVVENGRVVEGFKRNSNVLLNSNNPLALIDGSGDDNNLGKWKEFNLSDNSYVVIAQNQKEFDTGNPIHNDEYYNELVSYNYNDEFMLFENVYQGDLVTYVMRDGNYLLDYNSQKIPLPVYEQKDEIRAVWMATVSNIDLPKMVNGNINDYKNAITSRLDHIASLNFNTVFFQIRPMNDAFYNSDLAPWSRYITGTEGVDPGFDVLDFVIDEAHQRGLELHGWLNPYRVANSNAVLNSMDPDNFAYGREYLWLQSGGQTILDPGQPEVQEYIVDVIDEIITKYPTINGIHFDDYFYLNRSSIAENSNSPDYQTYLNNRTSSSQSIADFRRESVTKVIRNIFNNVEAFNQLNGTSIKFGISPSGIWDNIGSNPNGSHTAGMAHYRDLYADTKAWIDEEIVHYMLPQLYWPFDKFNSSGNPIAPFANLVKWWHDQVQGKDVDLLIGVGFYRQNGSDWLYYNELNEQIRYLEQFEDINGLSIYTYHTFNINNSDIKRSIQLLKNHLWTEYVNPNWSN